MFGSKARRIHELEGMLTEYNTMLDRVRDENASLKHTLRAIDDQIFSMTTKPDWETMRPHFQTLSEGTMMRKTIESNRISNLLVKELNNV